MLADYTRLNRGERLVVDTEAKRLFDAEVVGQKTADTNNPVSQAMLIFDHGMSTLTKTINFVKEQKKRLNNPMVVAGAVLVLATGLPFAIYNHVSTQEFKSALPIVEKMPFDKELSAQDLDTISAYVFNADDAEYRQSDTMDRIAGMILKRYDTETDPKIQARLREICITLLDHNPSSRIIINNRLANVTMTPEVKRKWSSLIAEADPENKRTLFWREIQGWGPSIQRLF